MNIKDLVLAYRNNKELSNEQLKQLYDEAKESYYNEDSILEDFEFDDIENKLGLENVSYIGTKHNPAYTIKHPFIMGSLSKVQIHADKDGNIDWEQYFIKTNKYVKPYTYIITTPKYDGCSFEAVLKDGNILSISSRGDGNWGKDYSKHIRKQVNKAIEHMTVSCKYVLRGEVLIDKNVFKEKYSEFVNPRSFVSGILNRDYTEEIESICDDLSIVIYDTRYLIGDHWTDFDWTDLLETKSKDNYIPKEYLPDFYTYCDKYDNLQDLYEKFLDYRINKCKYALDGFVIKPVVCNRINNITESRPTDCVAIKFIPMLEETTVRSIYWNLGKSGEYIPVVYTDPVIMDGKSVTKAKANNYGYLIKNKISVGTKIIFSLAGDIIPFIYKVTDTSNFDENKLDLPNDKNTYINGIHLMADLNDEEKRIEELRNSAASLNINKLGAAGIDSIVEYIKNYCSGDEFFDIPSKEIPNNIFLIEPEKIEKAIGGKIGETVRKEFEKLLKNLDLKTVILSCNFKLCGEKVASQIEAYLLDKEYNFSSMAKEAYSWCKNKDSIEINQIYTILNNVGYSIDDFKKKSESSTTNVSNQIPVILTGEPNDYKSKGEFLSCHPEYKLTGSWKEVKIVFTNSMDSNTGKMKKAREKNVEIRLY